MGGPAVRPAQTARGQRVTVRHTARAASIAQLAQPSQPLPAAVCRACSVHASTGAPHPTWSPRALTTSREAADQAPRSPSEADLRGAGARGLSYYPYLGPETFSTGHAGLRWPCAPNGWVYPTLLLPQPCSRLIGLIRLIGCFETVNPNLLLVLKLIFSH